MSGLPTDMMDGDTVSHLQRLLFLEKRPEITTEILELLQKAGATETPKRIFEEEQTNEGSDGAFVIELP